MDRQNNPNNNEAATPGVEAAPPGVATRTRSATGRTQSRSITDEAILSAIEISAVPLVTRRLASRKFPMQMLCEIAGAVLDAKTGELMEYRHLLKNPEYCDVWSKAGGKEIGRNHMTRYLQIDERM